MKDKTIMTGKEHQYRVDQYFSKRSETYCRETETGLWSFWKQREFAAVLKALQPLAGCRILEAGCGQGWYARRLAEYSPSQYVALDRVFSMGNVIRSHKISVMVGELINMPFQTQFDRILCAGALEFVYDPARFFSEVSRLLAPQGKMVLLAPSKTLSGKVYQWWHKRHGFRIHLFQAETLARLASSEGLRVFEIQKPMPFSLVATIRKS